MASPGDLHAFLFDGAPHPLSAALLAWLQASPRFCAFVETYRDKIRKKIRVAGVAGETEAALDLGSELEIAYRLLEQPRFTLAYEPYNATNRRGPDFAVTYRANLVFNVEVTRLRSKEPPPPPPETGGVKREPTIKTKSTQHLARRPSHLALRPSHLALRKWRFPTTRLLN